MSRAHTARRALAVIFAALSACAGAVAQSPTPTPARTVVKSDWKFPAPGLKSEYSDELKATVYDVGEGFHAARVRVGERAFVFVSIPPGGEVEDSDLALLVADKVLRLPEDLAETILPRKEKHEFLFRTASGWKAGVTLAHDRKTAIVRIVAEDSELQ